MTKKYTIKTLLLLMSIVYPVTTLYPAAAPINTVYKDDIKIIEDSSLEQITNATKTYQATGHTVLVLIDIDNTVAQKNTNPSNQELPYIPVDPKNTDFIRQIQQLENVIVLGFTARKIQEANLAEIALQLVGINYSTDAARFNFQSGPFYADPKKNQGFGYQNGIIYCQRFNPENPDLDKVGAKDEALILFLQQNIKKINPHNNPLVVIIADDQMISIAQGIQAIKTIVKIENQKEDGIDITTVLCKITGPGDAPALRSMLIYEQDPAVAKFEEIIIRGLLKSNSKNNQELLQAVHRRDQNGIKKLLYYKASPNTKSEDYNQTPLMFAAAYGYTDMMELLLNAHANPGATDINQDTALIIAEKLHKDSKSLLEQIKELLW